MSKQQFAVIRAVPPPGLVAGVVALIAFSPGDSVLGIVVEVVLLAGMVPLVAAVLTQLTLPVGAFRMLPSHPRADVTSTFRRCPA